MESGNQKQTKIFLIIALVIIVALVSVIVFLILNPLNKENLDRGEKENNTSGITQNEEVKNDVKQEEKKEETADDRMARYAQNLKETYYNIAKNEEFTAPGGEKGNSKYINKFSITGELLKRSYNDVSRMYVDKEYNLVVGFTDSTEMKIDSNVSGIYQTLTGQDINPIVLVTHFDGHVSYLQQRNIDGLKIQSITIEGISNIVSVVSSDVGCYYYFLIDIDGNVINPMKIEQKR